MPKISRSILTPYSAQQMFDLVADVPSYASFLPHISGARILERSDAHVIAEIDLKISGIKKSFSTRNTHELGRFLNIELVSGPFKHLDGTWSFESLGHEGTKVIFELDYEFSIAYLDKLIGPQFRRLSDNIVNAFAERARKIYG